jgi:hypothetical protein
MLDRTFEMRVLDGINRKLVELAKPALDLKDKVEKKEKKYTSDTIQEAVTRFDRPLVKPKDPSEDSILVVDEGDDDDTESVIALTKAAERKEAKAKAKKEAREKAKQEAKDAGKPYYSSSDEETSDLDSSSDDSSDEGNTETISTDNEKGAGAASLFRALDSTEDYSAGIEEVMRFMNMKPATAASTSAKKPPPPVSIPAENTKPKARPTKKRTPSRHLPARMKRR